MKDVVISRIYRAFQVTAVCFAALLLAGVIPAEALACTAIYVGKKVSQDGTIIIARSNDTQNVWGNYIQITEGIEKAGRKMPVNDAKTVFEELPDVTYRYVATPWFDSTTAANGLANDAAVCTNEKGVSMTMSVTAFSNKAALDADPLVETGLTEDTADDLVTCQADSARKATEILLGLIDKYGSSEVNIALISDQKETWYIEMYSGHQYAAVKLPDDRVSVFGNEFSLEYISDYEDAILSPELESLPKEKGFAVYGDKHELNLLATYSGQEVVRDYSHMRTWIGHQVLAPSEYKEDYDAKAIYPLCFVPEKKVSVQDAMELMRNRYENTNYCPDDTDRDDIRVIGTDTALSVHVVQIYPDLPATMSNLIWESSGPALYGVYIPVSNAALSVSGPYGRNQPADQKGVFDTDRYPYYRFKELNTLCVGRSTCKIYGSPVRSYWHQAETGMVKGMKQVMEKAAALDQDKAAKYITDYCNGLQDQAFSDVGHLLNDVRWYSSQNSNTMKFGINPETNELNDTPKQIDPMKINMDPSVYEEVPAAP